MVKEKMANKNT